MKYYIGQIPLAAVGLVVGISALLFASQAQADLTGVRVAAMAILAIVAIALSTVVFLRGTG